MCFKKKTIKLEVSTFKEARKAVLDLLESTNDTMYVSKIAKNLSMDLKQIHETLIRLEKEGPIE